MSCELGHSLARIVPKAKEGVTVLGKVLQTIANIAAGCVQSVVSKKTTEVPEGWKVWSLEASSRDMERVSKAFFEDGEKGMRVMELSKLLDKKAAALEAAGLHGIHGCEALGEETLRPAWKEAKEQAADCRAFVVAMNGLNLIRRAPKYTKTKLEDSVDKLSLIHI